MTVTLILVVIIALLFDFTNGFHDTANSIATMIGTRAVSPQVAVFMATSLNFCGAFYSLKVAGVIGKDIINADVVTLNVVIGWADRRDHLEPRDLVLRDSFKLFACTGGRSDRLGRDVEW